MTKNQLIALLAEKQPHLWKRDVDSAVNCIIEHLRETISKGERIEIRGFGSFALKARSGKNGRNPRTGEIFYVPRRYILYFRPGLDMRDKADASRHVKRFVQNR